MIQIRLQNTVLHSYQIFTEFTGTTVQDNHKFDL